MSRAFAQLRDTSFSTTGTIYLTFNVTFVDPALVLVSAHDIVVQIDASDTALAMKTKISDAIKAKGTELGLAISNNEITMPAFSKG